MKRMEPLVFLFLLFSFIIPHNVSAYISNGIVINEVQPEGDGSASNPDWIELYNNGTTRVSISYWIITNQNDTLWDNVTNVYNSSTGTYPHCKNNNPSGTDCLYMIPPDPNDPNYDLWVNPGCYVVIYNNSGTNDYSCNGDNKIVLHMGYDNQDTLIQDGDDVSLIPYYYYSAANGETGYMWVVSDYFDWEVNSNNSSRQAHPTHCGLYANSKFYEYPNFQVHIVDSNDAQNQCDQGIYSYYYLPYNWPLTNSTKAMGPDTDQLHSSYQRVPNGYDSDATSNWVVAVDSPGTTALSLVYFKADSSNGKVIVSWKPAIEADIIGYDVYVSQNGEIYKKINKRLIKAKGPGAVYSYVFYVNNISKVKIGVSEFGQHYYFVGPVTVNKEENNAHNYSVPKNTDKQPLLINNKSFNTPSSGCESYDFFDYNFAVLLLLVLCFLILFKKRIGEN